MKKKKENEFKIDLNFITSFVICCIILFCAIYFATLLGRIEDLNNEKECIDYYLQTGYILKECTNYDNLKK